MLVALGLIRWLSAADQADMAVCVIDGWGDDGVCTRHLAVGCGTMPAMVLPSIETTPFSTTPLPV